MTISRLAFGSFLLIVSSIAFYEETWASSPTLEYMREIRVHKIESPDQSEATQVRVLLPPDLDTNKFYPVIYVLPVEQGRESRYGDGLLEVREHRLHKKYNCIFVAPTFSQLPWYADHPDVKAIRQESYFLKTVVPFVEKTYPVSKKPEDRLLLGFSKSGWGAWSLLLRHPDFFGRAAAWDAPMMMKQIGKYGNGPIFGTQENFETYRIDNLLRANAESLQDQPRLILTGIGNFADHHEQAHQLLEELKIPHHYRDTPERSHDWHSGWVSEAVELLMKE
ncbi:MAG TPA: hypothetical protein DD473_24350 [Planctomycetaceae bacterium]|nr:hypothetical protein [Planctomycetaceae bacterium]